MRPKLPSPWRLLLLAALLAVLPDRTVLALSVSTVSRADTDSLIVQFGQAGVFPTIVRTGPREISLRFPPGSLRDEKQPENLDFNSSRLVEGARMSGDTVLVTLRTDGFGYVGWPDGEHSLKLQIYRDPSGANWTPAEASTTSPPAGQPTAGSSVTLPVTPPNNKPGPLELPPLPPAVTQPAPQAAPTQTAAKEPYYAIPSSLRAPASHVGPDKAATLRPGGLAPGAPSPQADALPVLPGGATAPASAPGGLRVKLPPLPPEIAAGGASRGQVPPPPPAPVPPAPQAAAVPALAAEPGTPGAPEAASPGAGAPGQAGQPGRDAEEENADSTLLVAAQAEKQAGNYEAAKNMLEGLRAKNNLTKETREETLHTLAALYTDMYKDDPGSHYDQIQGAYQEAINANPTSYRVPEALLQLGMLNLRVGNLPEAKGYFSVLTKKYPSDANVPLVNFYWGEYYYNSGDYKKAAEEYQNLIEKFPESKYVREGAMGLAKTLVKVGRYKEAAEIADYIDKRWPRYYVDYPPILRINGDIAYRNGDYKRARDYYMMFYNIQPKIKDADLVLARLGDIYAKLDNKPAAVDFYNMAVKDYPDAEGGLISKMRLAEQGVHDQPSINEMFTLFGKPAYGSPEDIYTSIIRDHPDSPLAPLAQIKLAMWYLYQQNFPDAIKAASRFLESYPKSELAPRATEVAVTAFEKMATDLLARKDYDRLVQIWRDSPLIQANRDKLSDHTRLGMALAFYRTGNGQDALAAAMPFIGPKENDDGNMALAMALSVYQNDRNWNEIINLARKVQGWKFGPSKRRNVEFAVAEALQNLGDTDRSRMLWQKLAGDQSLESGKRCYAMYYMARESLAKKELEKAELYAGEAAAMFKETGKSPELLKGSLNILVESAKGLGQYPTALKWAEQYASMCKEGDDDWTANRFRIASIQRAMGDEAGWRKTLTAIRDAAPQSLYGQMAASDLSTAGLENSLQDLSQTQ